MRTRRTNAAVLGASALLAVLPFPAIAAAAEPSRGLERGYDRIHDRVERLGGDPGRDIVEHGIRRDGRVRDADRREVVRSIRTLRRMEAQLRGVSAAAAPAAAAPAAAPAAGSTAGAGLQAIAACESGGDPAAVSPDGTYRGKYQFDVQTWQSVGGSGDPAAAPEAEQDARAAALMAQRGSSPWPVCG